MTKFTFDHIHLFTRNPEATATFYERMFGAEVIRTMQQGKPRIDLKLGGANIFILDVSQDPKAGTGPAHPHQGLDHFGLEVKNIDAACADLKSKGVVFTRGPGNHSTRHPHRLPDRTRGRLDRAPRAHLARLEILARWLCRSTVCRAAIPMARMPCPNPSYAGVGRARRRP